MYHSAFTYRFSEYVQSDQIKNSCGWKCDCAPINLDQMCNCEKSDEIITIESPYAALLIQLECDPSKTDPNWAPSSVTINLVKRPDFMKYEITSDEPLLKQIQLMPKPGLKIDYRFSYFVGPRMVTPPGFDMIGLQDMVGKTKLYILIPGWTSNVGKLIHSMHENIHKQDRTAAILIVDWLHGNQFYLKDNERVYDQAAANAVYVGYHLGTNLFSKLYFQQFSHDLYFHMIGFDIGAHVAHFAAKHFEELYSLTENPNVKINRITGLDPPFYLFENDGLRQSSADFVDIIHTNSISEELDMIENLKLRQFGDYRRLGHVDVFVNYENGDHVHDLCEHDGEVVMFGCASALSGHIFLDSILKNSPAMFTGKNENGNEALIGIFANKDSSNGQVHFEYKTSICSVNHFSKFDFPPTLTREEHENIAKPFHMLRNQRIDSIPQYETSDKVSRTDKETDSCGTYGQSGQRVWQGINAIQNQFPWTVCVAKELHSIIKYEFFVAMESGQEKLFRLPEVALMKTDAYSGKDRISSLEKERTFVFSAPKLEKSCTGSIIGKHWILTAAHCFLKVVNEQKMAFVTGSTDCPLTESSNRFDIKVEMVNPDRNVHIHPTYAQTWEDSFGVWINELTQSGLKAPLTAEQSHLPIAVNRSMFVTRPIPGFSGSLPNFGRCPETKKFEPYHDAPTGRWSSDIAIVHIEQDLTKSNDANEICIAGSKSFDYFNFDKYFYSSGFGSKGFNDRNRNDFNLTWIPLLNQNQLKIRNINLEFTPPMFGRVGYHRAEFVSIVNTDMVDGRFITSAICRGDSGGPVFVYSNGDHAVQVAVVTGSDTYVSN